MNPIVSPCVNVCEMDEATGWCRGCARRLDEIAGWGSVPASRRQQVMAELPARQSQMQRLGRWLGPLPAAGEGAR